jgi:hypothetical protein
MAHELNQEHAEIARKARELISGNIERPRKIREWFGGKVLGAAARLDEIEELTEMEK